MISFICVLWVSDDVNCEMGSWLGWSDCLGDCEFAVKLNYRHIVVSLCFVVFIELYISQ